MKSLDDSNWSEHGFILHPSALILSLVGALGVEPRTLRLSGANTAYKAAALPIELCPDKISPKSQVHCPKSAWSK
jgi:hypothetical protein